MSVELAQQTRAFLCAKGRPVRMLPVSGRTLTLCDLKHDVIYIAYLDNVDHRQRIPANLNNKIKVNNSLNHFISNVIIWGSFTILLRFSVLFYFFDMKQGQMAPVITGSLCMFSDSIDDLIVLI